MEAVITRLAKQHTAKGRAALSKQGMVKAGVEKGQYITVESGQREVTLEVGAGDFGNAIRGTPQVAVGLYARKKLGVSPNDTVTIQKADVVEAEEVYVDFPESFGLNGTDEEIAEFVGDKLTGRAVYENETIPISVGIKGGGGAAPEQHVTVQIDEVTPASPAVVERTDIDVDISEIQHDPAEETVSSHVSPGVAYEDIGGLDREIERIREMVELPMRHPELFSKLGVKPPKGLLLHGPPGTGKTLLAKAVANEVDAHFTTLSAAESEPEDLIEAFERASENSPGIIFIDEIEVIAGERGEVRSGGMTQETVSQLLTLMDGLDERGDVTVIAATNRVDAIDRALRRGGRFDREMEVGIPDVEERREILQIHTRDMPLGDDVDLRVIAEKTHGFVGADVENLVREAGMAALRRLRPHMDFETDSLDAAFLHSLEVIVSDFEQALTEVGPSALREFTVGLPSVEWRDVGGLEDAKQQLRQSIELPSKYPEAYEIFDVEGTSGVLLHGPPGTGKTLLAKAAANETDRNFLSVKGPESISKWVGESEKNIRELFRTARSSAPTILFFDEFDAIAPNRGSASNSNNVMERTVSQLLTELDGIQQLDDVLVIATTNQRELIDDALLRPGRLETHIYVGEPDRAARREIFEIHTEDCPLAEDVDLDLLAEETSGLTGAEIESVCENAAMATLQDVVDRADEGHVMAEAKYQKIRMERFGSAIRHQRD